MPRPSSRPAYSGHPAITGLTAISPKITCCLISGYTPFVLQVSAEQTTVTASAGADAYMDLEYRWNFGDSGGSETFTDHYTGRQVNANTDQFGPEAAYCYRDAGNYTVTLTARGKDENGAIVSASTTTVLRLGEFQYFDGGATSGTFYLTVDGQDTNNIAYNATTATIVSELAALSTVGAGNVRDTGYGTWQFCGSLAGQSITHTGTFTGLGGAGVGDAAPDLIERFSSGTSASVAVSDLSTWAAVYVDANAAGGGNGSEGSPYNSWSAIKTHLETELDNRVVYYKRGSDITADSRMLTGNSGRRIVAYGAGADPILRDGAIGDALLQLESYLIASRPLVKDFVLDGIDIRANEARAVLQLATSGNGTPGSPANFAAGFHAIDCTFTREAGSESMHRTNSPSRCHGIVSWRCQYDGGNFSQLASLNAAFGSWLAVVGCVLSGGTGNDIYNHHIYPSGHNNWLFRWIQFQAAGDLNYCINTTCSLGNTACQWVTIDGCDITGTHNAIDFSNVNNSYSPDSSHFDKVVVQHNLVHSGKATGQMFGIWCYNLKGATVRYNDWWDNSVHIYAEDANTRWRLYYNNSYGESPLVHVWQESGYCYYNKCHATGSAGIDTAMVYQGQAIDITTWDIDNNTWYAPLATQPFYDNQNVAFRALATWQGYGHDASGQVADPLFDDPANGVMVYDWQPLTSYLLLSAGGVVYAIST